MEAPSAEAARIEPSGLSEADLRVRAAIAAIDAAFGDPVERILAAGGGLVREIRRPFAR